MRYSLALPLALAAFAAAPLSAQNEPAATPPEAAEPATPPADTTTAPTDVDTTTTPDTTAEATPVDDAIPPATSTDAAPAAEPAPVAPGAPSTAAPGNLTPEQKAAYDAWPAEAKAYYDGLSPARQQLFLRITDADKLKIVALEPAQQEQVWSSLEKQAADQQSAAPAPGN